MEQPATSRCASALCSCLCMQACVVPGVYAGAGCRQQHVGPLRLFMVVSCLVFIYIEVDILKHRMCAMPMLGPRGQTAWLLHACGCVCCMQDNHSMELHLRVAAGCDLSPPPRQQQPQDTRAAGLQVPSTAIRSLAVSLCPLSTIQAAMPCIAVGGADGSVAIYDLSTPVLQAASGHVAASLSAAVVPRLYTSGQQGRRAMGASAGGAGMGVHAAAPGVYAVSVLHGHHACVAAVGWCYDESLLASVDAGGTLIVWRRTALF